MTAVDVRQVCRFLFDGSTFPLADCRHPNFFRNRRYVDHLAVAAKPGTSLVSVDYRLLAALLAHQQRKLASYLQPVVADST